MIDYVIGLAILVAFVLAARSYFGKHYGDDGCSTCSGCPHANKCQRKMEKK